jgi:hypothetical protein
MRRTARKIFNVSHDSSTPKKNCTFLFLIGEDDIARFDSQRYRSAIPLAQLPDSGKFRKKSSNIEVEKIIYGEKLELNFSVNSGIVAV